MTCSNYPLSVQLIIVLICFCQVRTVFFSEDWFTFFNDFNESLPLTIDYEKKLRKIPEIKLFRTSTVNCLCNVLS